MLLSTFSAALAILKYSLTHTHTKKEKHNTASSLLGICFDWRKIKRSSDQSLVIVLKQTAEESALGKARERDYGVT